MEREVGSGEKAETRRRREGPAKLKPIERSQLAWVAMDAEQLIPLDHKARAIWELSGKLDLSSFGEPIRSTTGSAGRAAWDPRLLVSIWVYNYSKGMGSARQIEREMDLFRCIAPGL